MLHTKNPLYKVIVIISLVLIVPCFVVCIQTVTHPDALLLIRVGGGFSLIALAAAFYYIINGYTKNQSMFFKGFVASFALSQLVSLLLAGTETNDMMAVLMNSLAFGLVTAMLFSKDLGKIPSLILCALIIIINADNLVGVLMNMNDNPAIPLTLLTIRAASHIVLSIILIVTTYAKYIDKEERNTK